MFSTPVQFNDSSLMRVEVWPAESPDEAANWDHIADIDLDSPSGWLMFRPSGPVDEATPCEVPPGAY